MGLMANTVVTMFLSLSGGQGKTLSTYMSGIKSSKLGYETLLIDADPQHNLTDWLNVEVPENSPTLLEVLKGEVSIEDAIYEVPGREKLFIVPCDRALSTIQYFLSAQPNPSYILEKRLKPVLNDFSAVIIDTPPQRGHIVLTSIGASNLVFIPAEAASKGVGSLTESLTLLEECRETRAFNGELGAVIPFRARVVGYNFTKDTSENIQAMKEIVGDNKVLPPVLESEVYKRSLNYGKIPSELEPSKADLEIPFDTLMGMLFSETKEVVGK